MALIFIFLISFISAENHEGPFYECVIAVDESSFIKITVDGIDNQISIGEKAKFNLPSYYESRCIRPSGLKRSFNRFIEYLKGDLHEDQDGLTAVGVRG